MSGRKRAIFRVGVWCTRWRTHFAECAPPPSAVHSTVRQGKLEPGTGARATSDAHNQRATNAHDQQTNNTQTIGSRHFSGDSADSHRFSNPRSTVLGVSHPSFITHLALFGPSARRRARHSLSNSVLGIIGSGLRTPTPGSARAGHDTVYPTRSSEMLQASRG